MRHKPQWPRNAAEWRDAVDVAEFFLLMDSARQYGLITGGPDVNTERCVAILEAGRARGFSPAPADVLAKRYLGAGLK